MTYLYVPPEIWEHILQYTMAECKICNNKYSLNCYNTPDINCSHSKCGTCEDVICLNANESTAEKCTMCIKNVHKKCLAIERIQKPDSNAVYYRIGCKPCVESSKKALLGWDCIP